MEFYLLNELFLFFLTEVPEMGNQEREGLITIL